MENLRLTAFTNNKTKDTHPDYKINIQIGNNYEEVGGGWKKTNDKGEYISISLKTELIKQAIAKLATVEKPEPTPVPEPIPTIDYPQEEINVDDIPF